MGPRASPLAAVDRGMPRKGVARVFGASQPLRRAKDLWDTMLRALRTQACVRIWARERESIVTDAAGGGREEMERRIVQRSLEDDAFRQQLLEDPKGTVERELGTPLPEGVEVRAVEETADTVFLVLPSTSPLGEGVELSDSELESVAGGDWVATNTCGESGNTCNYTCGC